MLFYGTVRELSDFLAGRGRERPLDEAALLLATIEFPGLEVEPFLQILDSYAAELAERLHAGSDFVPAANHYLFQECGAGFSLQRALARPGMRTLLRFSDH